MTTHTQIRRTIFVTFQKEGIHCYPQALTDPKLADVSFLGHPHRHIFHFKVTIEVFYDDRDIEFIQFKRWLTDVVTAGSYANNASCEMLANDLCSVIVSRYPTRNVSVEVSEDGENGATITWEKEEA